MYLSLVKLKNWRSYEDTTFKFDEPKAGKPIVLIGAMNGHGKTSFLVALYLGLFGRFGLKYCEGYASEGAKEPLFYRKVLPRFRRNVAEAGDPTAIELTFTPTSAETQRVSEVRVCRRWHFGSNAMLKQNDFEEVHIYENGRLVFSGAGDEHTQLTKLLFPDHVLPAFFFDGEQAQSLIHDSGNSGIRQAVEVMFGTKTVDEVFDRITRFIASMSGKIGGKKSLQESEQQLSRLEDQREVLEQEIATLQNKEKTLETKLDKLKDERSSKQEEFSRLGGLSADEFDRVHSEYMDAEKKITAAESSLVESVQNLGPSLAVVRLGSIVLEQLRKEHIREEWENLKVGTIQRVQDVLQVAMPEPSSCDELLGHLSPSLRNQVKARFSKALEQIYDPPPPDCAQEYTLGHVRGQARRKVEAQVFKYLGQARSHVHACGEHLITARAKFENAKSSFDRLKARPQETEDIERVLSELQPRIDSGMAELRVTEHEIVKKKEDLKQLSARIGELREQIAKQGPEQKRLLVAERVRQAAAELNEALRPLAVKYLEESIAKYFSMIGDKRFRDCRIVLPKASDGTPLQLEERSGKKLFIETMSGFERRTFGMAFSLSLAELTGRRIPLVIDTPLGNADSKYRPRTLKALTGAELDQIIILTHDKEVDQKLYLEIKSKVSQCFLVEYSEELKASVVSPNKFFGDDI